MNNKRKLRGFLIVLGPIVLSMIGLGAYFYNPSSIGYWRTPKGRSAYMKTYQEAMKLLPSPSRTLDVSTSYGTVRVYEWSTPATRSAPPIVLVPGRSASVPMWANNLPDFVAKHPVYAMDTLGDAGMSVQTAKIENGTDQAAWLHEVLSSLNVTKFHIIGHSFGGWAAANYATRYPEKVASLILL